MEELARKIYDMVTDMDFPDYEEHKESDIATLTRELENLPGNSVLLQCLEVITETSNASESIFTKKELNTLSDCILAQMTQLSQSICGFPQFREINEVIGEKRTELSELNRKICEAWAKIEKIESEGNMMEEIRNENLEELLGTAEEMGWSYRIYKEDSDRAYVEMKKSSPAGGSFSIEVDFIEESEIISFLDDLYDVYASFDVDEYVDMYASQRGENGVPGTYKELLEDAESIEEMIKELYDSLHDRKNELMNW